MQLQRQGMQLHRTTSVFVYIKEISRRYQRDIKEGIKDNSTIYSPRSSRMSTTMSKPADLACFALVSDQCSALATAFTVPRR
jgi:hypothetical protein